MPVLSRRRVTAALLSLPLARPWLPSFAAEPVHLLVGYAPGGGADHIARIVADGLTGDGAPTIVDNRPGAAGQIALHEAARAGAQRETLLLGTVGSVSIAPQLPGAPDALVASLQPLAIVASTPHVLLVAGDGTPGRADSARDALARLLAEARRRPGDIAYASLGIHSSAHLVAEQMCRDAGITMAHVPYPGSARALVDLQGGHVALLFSTLQAALPLMRQGRVHALAVTGRTRSALAPAVPTFAESGLTGMRQDAWYGVLAAPTVVPARRAVLEARLARLLKSPALRQRLAQDGAEPLGLTGPDAVGYLTQQREVWRRTIEGVAGRLG
ncbi:Bug family tripartite tricarboxylate transporter substrate binding protein [Cupriavidus agavae]|uniref:Tripartite-type tricarboxylate transporter receptor subunit TctC n=1 Tax=Cupriavidus agavae TaxID=1001822 RepID=A0A4Q7RRQ3_9BURK|nr:tripartite tricarboxylate transporter substrate binding protein [Cupriavidus agavae]RZT36385.1 tripartite-type tricarboxylate transporter receptor subunit TctC [Cupriavidus agavae]